MIVKFTRNGRSVEKRVRKVQTVTAVKLFHFSCLHVKTLLFSIDGWAIQHKQVLPTDRLYHILLTQHPSTKLQVDWQAEAAYVLLNHNLTIRQGYKSKTIRY